MYDLNVPWPLTGYTPPDLIEVQNVCNVIATLYSLGYRYIAINFVAGETTKLPINKPDSLNPIPMADLRQRLKGFEGLRLFSRITIVVTDPAKAQSISKLNNTGAFDLIAVQPTTEKALQLTLTNMDIDIIALPMLTRLPYFLKHKTVGLSLARGVKFELCYSELIGGAAAYESSAALRATGHVSRKNFFSNCLQLIRAARSRGLVFSSGASEPAHVRNYADIIAIMTQLGLKVSNVKEGFTTNPEAALVKGRLRNKSNKQTVMVGNESGPTRTDGLVSGEAAKAVTLNDYKKNKRAADDEEPSKRRK